MTARAIWKQCWRYQRMTQDEEGWEQALLNKALARMPSKVPTPVEQSEVSAWMATVIDSRQDLLLRRHNSHLALEKSIAQHNAAYRGGMALPAIISVYGKPSDLGIKLSDFEGEHS